jgi:RimJ/RimL family protein N-acetyltransferase
MDRAAFFALNTHPDVVASLGVNPSREQSDATLDAFAEELDREGFGLWAVEVPGGARFAGMIGLHRMNPALPCAPAVEVGWRLHPDHWGHGYATEGAAAALRFGFDEIGLSEIVAITTVQNRRSQVVMERIGMVRDVDGDFDHKSLPEGSSHRRHVLYRVTPSQVRPTVSP